MRHQLLHGCRFQTLVLMIVQQAHSVTEPSLAMMLNKLWSYVEIFMHFSILFSAFVTNIHPS